MKTKITITEGLSELRLIDKKIASKQKAVVGLVTRVSLLADPIKTEGGSEVYISRELQAIGDLFDRKTNIRRAIRKANEKTVLKVNDSEMSVADWLVWRREVAETEQYLYNQIRKQVQLSEVTFVQNQQRQTELKQADLIINVDIKTVFDNLADIEETMERLDGKLSLINATTFIEF